MIGGGRYPFWRGVIREADLIPPGYGIAYYLPDQPLSVIHPIPFNLLVGWWRLFVWWCTAPPWRLHMWKVGHAKRYAYRDGYGLGYDDGRAGRKPRLFPR